MINITKKTKKIYLLLILVIFYFGCNKGTKEKKLHELLSLSIPNYLGVENIYQNIDKLKLIRSIYYSVSTKYPDKSVLNFYDVEFLKIGFEIFYPKMNSKIRQWSLFYNFVDGKRNNHAQLDSFWINRKLKIIAWLSLISEWDQEIDDSQKIERVILNVKGYNEINLKENIDVYELFGNNIPLPDRTNNLSNSYPNLEGGYSLSGEDFEFKVIVTSLNKKKMMLIKLPDLNGDFFYVENKSIITSNEIDSVRIESINYNSTSNEKKEIFNTENTIDYRKYISKKNSNKIYLIYFKLKRGVNKTFKIKKESRIGIINRNKILINAFVTEDLDINSCIKLELSEKDKNELNNIITALKLIKTDQPG